MNAVARAIRSIDHDGLLATLEELVAIQSLGGKPGEIEIQERVASRLDSWGCDVDAWEIDMAALATHPAFSAELDRARGLGVVGSIGVGGRSLILNGHTDVVPAGDHANWTHDPWRATVAHGRVYGRGTVDMKGGLVCGLFAIKAIIDAGISLAGRVSLQSVIGEEDGGTGTLASVLRGHTGDGAIIMEPTGLAIAPVQAGCFNFRVIVPGKAAHGAIRYEGVDPIEKFIPIYEAILEFERTRNTGPHHELFQTYPAPYPIAVGTIRAGVWASTVAEQLTFEGRYGIVPGEDLDHARNQFEDVVRNAAAGDPWLRDNPPSVSWWGGQFEPAITAADHDVVTMTSQALAEAAGRPAELRGMPFGADMRLLVNEGSTPTVMFGPGDVRVAHYADEYVPIDDLSICTETLIRTILEFCGVENADGSAG